MEDSTLLTLQLFARHHTIFFLRAGAITQGGSANTSGPHASGILSPKMEGNKFALTWIKEIDSLINLNSGFGHNCGRSFKTFRTCAQCWMLTCCFCSVSCAAFFSCCDGLSCAMHVFGSMMIHTGSGFTGTWGQVSQCTTRVVLVIFKQGWWVYVP
jgi:hypothetical protein